MSTKQKGPWAWRLRDLKGEPGPWHVDSHQRPAIAGGDNIEVIDVPEMVAGNDLLKAALRHEIRTTDRAEAQRDTLLMAAGDILQRKYANRIEPTHDEWMALRNAVINGQGSS